MSERMGCHGDREHRRRSVEQIASEMISSQLEDGVLNPDDEAQMEQAIRQAVADARAAYDAAEEYLRG